MPSPGCFLFILAKIPLVAVIALHVLAPGIFAIMHGSVLYRLKDAVIFTLLYLLVGNIFENLGVATGFPFGSYYFTDVMGPKLFHVPILLGLAYVGIGYVSWTLALLILGKTSSRLSGATIFAVAVVASFIMGPGIFPRTRSGPHSCTAGSGRKAVPFTACQ